jgi:NAD(P)-dependent dehydrogenase (short-subunit alcohol dehydrogenase family)
MNIVIIGGSKKLGKYLANSFSALNHKVFILSHQVEDFPTTDIPDCHLYANFNDRINLISKFDKLIHNIEKIDIFIYCSTYQASVDNYARFKSNNIESVEEYWIKNLQVNVTIPHDLIRRSLLKMDHNCKVVFFTTGLTIDFNRQENLEWSHYAEYAGTKSAQNHLMLAFATNNDKKVTFFSISPHFTEETVNTYVQNPLIKWSYGSLIIDAILNSDHLVNGKILPIYHN